MAIATVFAVISLAKTSNKFLRLVISLMSLGVLWTIIDNEYLGNHFILYFLGISLFAVYTAITKGLDSQKRGILLIISLVVLLQGVFAVNQLPYVYILKGLQIVPLLLFLVKVLPSRANYKDEMGALVILATDALIQVISFVMHTVGS